MRTVLFRVPPLDFTILAAAAGVIAAVCLAACLLPSHRAARISPTEALAEGAEITSRQSGDCRCPHELSFDPESRLRLPPIASLKSPSRGGCPTLGF
jgi:hypothetical protein